MKKREFKVVMLGVSGVGKTSLLQRFTENIFNGRAPATCSLSYINHIITSGNTSIKLNIWDTAGQERFHCLVSIYYRNSEAAIVVYDIENPDSFQRAKSWVTTLRSQNPPTKIIALAANKSEPLKSHSAIELKEVMKYAKDNNLIFFETSAKTPLNVQELFMAVGTALIDDMNNYGQEVTRGGERRTIRHGEITDENGKSKSRKCC